MRKLAGFCENAGDPVVKYYLKIEGITMNGTVSIERKPLPSGDIG